MALKGDLASVDLAQVFQMLALNQKVGMLCIQSPRAWKALYFDPRGACLYFNEHIMLDRVMLQLTRTGRATEEGAAEAREHAAEQNHALAEVLLAGGYLTEEDLEDAMRTEMEEGIYDLFFWRDAHFEFFEGATTVDGREGQIDDRFFFSTDTLIMEAARRIDEWSFIRERVPGPLEIFKPIKNNSNVLNLEETALALYDLVDGKRNVARLTEVTGLPPFLVYKGLAQMLDEGLIESVQQAALIATAKKCVQEGRHQDAINLYEKAISLGEGIPESHEQVAIVYESSQEFELAAYHHKCVAEFRAGADELKKAVDILQHVVAMLPTDLAARERLVELTIGRPDLASKDFDPVANGKALVDLYLEIGEIERVRGVLERLLRDNPYDIELKKSLINVHTKVGDTKRVIELYESIAQDLEQQRQPIEAVKYLQKILMLDRSRKDISERIRSLYVMDERRRSRRRSLVALAALIVVLTALGGVYYLYEQYARERLAKIEAVVEKFVEAKDYVQAKSQYESFIKQFPLTMVSREVQGELGRIESLRLQHEAELANADRDRQRDLEKIRQSYKMAWAVYQGYVKENKLDQALAQIDAIAALVEKAGQQDDLRWAREIDLELNQRHLKDYMSHALSLDREAWDKFDAGDWLGARKLWLDLITKYEMTQTANEVNLPVMIRSRPSGARVFYQGKPLLENGQNGQSQKVTPCLVLCKPRTEQIYELHREGFEPAKLVVKAEERATADLIMTVIPTNRLRFPVPALGSVSASRGFLGVGLRGGKVAIAKINSAETQAILQLPGLDEPDGVISFTSDSAVFYTKEGYLSSHSLTNGVSRWTNRVKLEHQPIYELLIHNSRILLVDTEGRLVAFDAQNGERLWATPLGGMVAAKPLAVERLVRVGLRAGMVLLVDASNGRVVKRIKAPAGITTPIEYHDGNLVFGLDDGRVVAVREATGALVWSRSLPEAANVVAFGLAHGSVLLVDSRNRLSKFGLGDGRPEGELVLPGIFQSGPELSGRRVFVTVREIQRKGIDTDVLQAVGFDDLAVQWEYRDGGQFVGGVTALGADVFLPDSKGTVLHFQ